MIPCGAPLMGKTAACAACFKDHKSPCRVVAPSARGDALVLRDHFALPAAERDVELVRAAQTASSQSSKRAAKRGGGEVAAEEREARERDVAFAAMSRARFHWVEAQLAALALEPMSREEKRAEVARVKAFLGEGPPEYESRRF
ncbi:hypothetical protein ACQRIT_002218 [Beauveria bassiana]